MDEFEIIETGGRMAAKNETNIFQNKTEKLTKGDKAMDILANNFDNILELAGSIVEIQKMKVASEACLAKMAEDRKGYWKKHRLMLQRKERIQLLSLKE